MYSVAPRVLGFENNGQTVLCYASTMKYQEEFALIHVNQK